MWHLIPDAAQKHVLDIVDKWNKNVMEPVGNFFERNYQRIVNFIEANFGDIDEIHRKLRQFWENVKGVSFAVYGDAKEIFKAAFNSVWKA